MLSRIQRVQVHSLEKIELHLDTRVRNFMRSVATILLVISLFPMAVYATEMTDLEARLAELEAKIKVLESENKSTDGLKVQDFNDRSINDISSQGMSTQSIESQLTPAQIQLIQDTLADFQKKKAESDKALQDINDYFGIKND